MASVVADVFFLSLLCFFPPPLFLSLLSFEPLAAGCSTEALLKLQPQHSSRRRTERRERLPSFLSSFLSLFFFSFSPKKPPGNPQRRLHFHLFFFARRSGAAERDALRHETAFSPSSTFFLFFLYPRREASTPAFGPPALNGDHQGQIKNERGEDALLPTLPLLPPPPPPPPHMDKGTPFPDDVKHQTKGFWRRATPPPFFFSFFPLFLSPLLNILGDLDNTAPDSAFQQKTRGQQKHPPTCFSFFPFPSPSLPPSILRSTSLWEIGAVSHREEAKTQAVGVNLLSFPFPLLPSCTN